MSAELTAALKRQRERLAERAAERAEGLAWRLKANPAATIDGIDAIIAKNDAALAALLDAVEALVGYTEHETMCPMRRHERHPCRCNGPENARIVARFIAAEGES